MNLSALELATAVASSLGYDVDIEPLEPGKVSVVAFLETSRMKFTGQNVTAACVKLVAELTKESV